MEKYKTLNYAVKSNMEIKIVTFTETPVAALEHIGPHQRVYDTTRKFLEWRKANGLSPGSCKTFGIHYSDHRSVPPQEYRFDICVSYAKEVKPNSQGVVSKLIPGGRCATFRHHGSREHIEGMDFLYGKWLADSGEELRDYPPFFHYVNVGPDVAEHEMITDVYAPLK